MWWWRAACWLHKAIPTCALLLVQAASWRHCWRSGRHSWPKQLRHWRRKRHTTTSYALLPPRRKPPHRYAGTRSPHTADRVNQFNSARGTRNGTAITTKRKQQQRQQPDTQYVAVQEARDAAARQMQCAAGDVARAASEVEELAGRLAQADARTASLAARLQEALLRCGLLQDRLLDCRAPGDEPGSRRRGDSSCGGAVGDAGSASPSCGTPLAGHKRSRPPTPTACTNDDGAGGGET